MSTRPTVYVVDDDDAVRDALGVLLEGAGLAVDTLSGARAFLERGEYARPGCLVADVRMPGMSGLDLQEALRSRGITLPVILITGHGDVPMAIRAMKCGAVDFLEKPFDAATLVQRVRDAVVRDSEQMRMCECLRRLSERMARLSPREREVMDGVVAGKLNKAIAAELRISQSTVETHRKRVMEKLGAGNISDLVRIAVTYREQGP